MTAEMTLIDPLRRAERLNADGIAVIDGDTVLSYREFASRARRLGFGLRARGVAAGDRVAVLMLNSHRYLEAYFGIPGSGLVIVPLNNRNAVAEHRYALEDAGVSVLLADDASASVAEQLAGSVKEVIIGDAYEHVLVADDPGPITVETDALAGLFYTGGTTGRSKGVMLTHRNLVANAMHTVIALGYRGDDRYLHAAPMFHLADGASTYAVTWVGGCHVFVPAFEPSAVLDAVATHRVTVTTLVPTMVNALVNAQGIDAADLSSLRLVLHGGAPIATDLLTRAIDAIGCSFTQGYGMTEAAPLLTVLAHEEHLLGDDRLRSAGQEIVGVEVRVVRDDGTACDVGEIGEIIARGPNIMRGYWHKPDDTSAVLRNGWYSSGDLGYLDATGHVYIVDRAKDMIISGGENVYSTEVEDAVMAHPDVLECAVIGVPDDHWGERVHLAVVPKPGTAIDLDEIRTFCRDRIASYKTPRSIEILDALPKSGAGKVLKRELRDRHWSHHERAVN